MTLGSIPFRPWAGWSEAGVRDEFCESLYALGSMRTVLVRNMEVWRQGVEGSCGGTLPPCLL